MYIQPTKADILLKYKVFVGFHESHNLKQKNIILTTLSKASRREINRKI